MRTLVLAGLLSPLSSTKPPSSVTLVDLVIYAFGVEDFQVSGGPAWTRASSSDADAFQVVGQPQGDAIPPKDQFREMVKTLLADRFQFKFHQEMRDFPAYELVIAKDASKLKDATSDPNAHTLWSGGAVKSVYSAKKTSMAEFASMI